MRDQTQALPQYDDSSSQDSSHLSTGAGPNESPGTFAAADSDDTVQIQLSLRADQLARLWLREPSLNPNNVFAWSAEKGQWVPALKISRVAAQIAKARIESVRMWSVLCASRISASIAPPPKRPQLPVHPVSDQVTTGGEWRLALGTPSPEPSAAPQVQPSYFRRIDLAFDNLLRHIRKLLATLASGVWFWSRRLRRHLRHKLALIGYVSVWALAAFVLGNKMIQNDSQIRALPETVTRAAPSYRQVSVANLAPIFISSTPQAEAFTQQHLVSAHENTPTASEGADLSAQSKGAVGTTRPRFDNARAERTIEKSALRVRDCTEATDLYAKLVVTFSPGGWVRNIEFAQFTGDASQRSCVASAIAQMKIAPFAGGPVKVSKVLRIRG